MRTVHVLLSTYNGEGYLEEQLNSLLEQGLPHEIRVWVRDDGSSDGTLGILRRFESEYAGKFHVDAGHNLGVVRSFFHLLEETPEEGYFAFCDQDDIWNRDKLARAITKLETVPEDEPAMYCSRTELIDKAGRHLGYWPPIPRREPAFENALIENIAVGCTIVLNGAAKRLISGALPDPDRVIMHDWWAYLCVSAFGQVIYDPQPSIRYRQHGSNAVGGTNRFIRKWRMKYANFRRNRRKFKLRAQAAEFDRLFGAKLPAGYRRVLNDFLEPRASLASRIRYAFSTKLYRQTPLDNLLFRILYVLKYI